MSKNELPTQKQAILLERQKLTEAIIGGWTICLSFNFSYKKTRNRLICKKQEKQMKY